MAHQTPIIRWMLKNQLRPSFVRFDWPSRYFGGVHDFEATVTIDGIQASGRGLDFNEELAVEKAAAESIERYICTVLGINSVGVAVSGAVGALKHAELEALERYYFDQHQIRKNPFSKISDPIGLKTIDEIQSRFERHNKGKGELSFFKMAVTPEQGIVAAIRVENELKFLGLALGTEINAVIYKAFFEAMGNFARFRDNPEKFERERVASADLWNCDPKFLSTLSSLFGGNSVGLIPKPTLEKTPIDIATFKGLSGCPIEPVRVTVQRGGNA